MELQCQRPALLTATPEHTQLSKHFPKDHDGLPRAMARSFGPSRVPRLWPKPPPRPASGGVRGHGCMAEANPPPPSPHTQQLGAAASVRWVLHARTPDSRVHGTVIAKACGPNPPPRLHAPDPASVHVATGVHGTHKHLQVPRTLRDQRGTRADTCSNAMAEAARKNRPKPRGQIGRSRLGLAALGRVGGAKPVLGVIKGLVGCDEEGVWVQGGAVVELCIERLLEDSLMLAE